MQESVASAIVQEPIAITLTPERIAVTAGGTSDHVVATVKNQTAILDNYVLEVNGLDPDWYDLPSRQLVLFPGEQKNINITFHVPADFETLDGRYDYTFEVKSRVKKSRAGQATGVLFVNLPEAINLQLKREMVRGQAGANDLTVTNRTRSPQLITLAGEDDENQLEISFDKSTLDMAGGTSQPVAVTLRPRAGQVLAGTHAFHYTLRATTVDGREKSNTVEGQFIYTPAQIRMELLPPRIKGVEGRFNLNIANPGAHPVHIEVAATSAEEALDIAFQLTSLALQPGTSVILPLTVRPRAGLKPELRPYPFTVTVRQGGSGPAAPEVGTPVTGDLLYAPAVEFGLEIERGASSPAQSDYLIKLTNPSLIGLRLDLRADDPQQALDLFFGGQITQLALPPGGDLAIPLLARLKGGPPPQQTAYPFSVTVHAIPSDGSSEIDKTARADLVAGATGPVLQLELLPPQMHGDTGRFQLRLTSGVGNPLQVVLRGRDEGATLQYEFAPARVQLMPGVVEMVELTVRPKNGQTAAEGQTYPFEVIAWVPGLGTDAATTRPGAWVYAPAAPAPARLSVHLNPPRAIGEGSQFQVNLVNEGNTPLTVVLRGSDDADALNLLFQVPRMQLQPREIANVSLIAKSRDGLPLVGPYRYPFEVVGWVPGSATGPASVARGELVVLEAPAKPPAWHPGQRLALAAMLIAWIVLPFIVDPIIRNNATLLYLLPLFYQYLPALTLPVVGTALYGATGGQMRGWRGVLVALLGLGGIVSYLLPLVLPAGANILGFPAIPFVNLALLPALLVVLFM